MKFEPFLRCLVLLEQGDRKRKRPKEIVCQPDLKTDQSIVSRATAGELLGAERGDLSDDRDVKRGDSVDREGGQGGESGGRGGLLGLQEGRYTFQPG